MKGMGDTSIVATAPSLSAPYIQPGTLATTEDLADDGPVILLLLLALLVAPLAAEAQQPGKVYRIGILTNKAASDPAESRQLQAFRLGLQERGWIEGENILIEVRAAEGNSARLPDLAADLVGARWT